MLGLRPRRRDSGGMPVPPYPSEPVDRPSWSDLPLREYRPQPMVQLPRTEVMQPAVAVIDAHNHLGRWLSTDWMTPDLPQLLAVMDAHGVERIVNLDGRWADELSANVARYDRAHPGRFTTFCHVDWARLVEPDGTATLLAQLEDCHRRGARGVKIWKDLGLTVRDGSGQLVMPDDPRVVAVVRRAGDLGLPVLIHVADPVAFFEPLDEHNERLEELASMPQWWFGDRDRHPTFDALMTALDTLVAAADGTAFIGAHVGCHAEDLAAVSAMLHRRPNFTVDLGGRLAEIGRQPRAFARLVAEHPTRVLFGTDAFPLEAQALTVAYRFLETGDEHFDYAPGEDVPPQGRWAISGAQLSAVQLEAVYRGNALRLGL
jgi:predicted TIM-barrel fold metal-dependent hydrolase